MTAIALAPTRLSRSRRRARPRARVESLVLRVDFDRSDGARWSALGGGRTLAEALRDARLALPEGRWELAGYANVYGD